MKNLFVQGYRRFHKALIWDLIQGVMLVLAFSWLFYDSFLAVLPFSPFIWFWHLECAETRKQKSEEQFRKMFREWILLLSSSLSAGYSVENAFGESARELQLMYPKGGLMLEELRSMMAQSENNERPEELLEKMASRHELDEIQSFAEIFRVARVSGGSLSVVIRNTAVQMAEVMDTKREIQTILASKVYEQKIMTVMPAAILLYIRTASPEFLSGLYHNPAGITVMTVCLGLYIAAYMLGKRMVRFEI